MELGDLLPLAGIPWKIGAEVRSDTGEPAAPDKPHPEWFQPVTVPIALEHRPDGENHVLPKPANFHDIARNQSFRIVDGGIGGVFTVLPGGQETLFGYRQYIDSGDFSDSSYKYGRTTLSRRRALVRVLIVA